MLPQHHAYHTILDEAGFYGYIHSIYKSDSLLREFRVSARRIGFFLFMTIMFILAFHMVPGDPVCPAAGELYEGGVVIRFPGADFFLTVPEKYSGFISPGEDVFVIERDAEEGYILVITESGMTSDQMTTLLYQFIPYESDILLIPTEMPEMDGNRYTLSYTAGSGEGAIKGRGMGILNHDGTGVIMFALGEVKLMERYEEVLNNIADSVVFTP